MLNRYDFLFFRRWLRDPLKIGAVFPSGIELARAMARQVDLRRPGVVVELGGGTGMVTSALLEAGVPAERLVVLEKDESLFELLRQRFPSVTILHGDATQVAGLVRELGFKRVSTVVSGLPILSMPQQIQQQILQESFELMGADGRFIQFTYGPASPVPQSRLRRWGLKSKPAGRVWLNFPPAVVWCFFRRRDVSGIAVAA